MGNQRVDFSRLARDRIEQAQAAISAAQASAINAYAVGIQAGSFHGADASPMAPWVASPSKGEGTFAERLRQHEAHLNSIKNAVPFKCTDPRSYHTSAPADSHMQGSIKPVNHMQLPPWSQPAQLPSFSSFRKSESIASKPSAEGSSRVSTAGSGATIGWAGPWVVTHCKGGADRMYPAYMRAHKNRGIQAATNMAQNPVLGKNQPRSDGTVVSQDALSHQTVQDVSWNLPPRNPAPSQHQNSAAVRPGVCIQTHSKPYGALAPVKHTSPQQSRIPSPTKSITKAGTVSATVHESRANRTFRQTDASHPKQVYQLQNEARKQPSLSAAGSSVGPGSLARCVREKQETSAQEDPSSNTGQQHVYKRQAMPRKVSQRPENPAWVGVTEETDQQPPAELSVTKFGRHADGDAHDSSMLLQHHQQHSLYSSGTSEGYGAGGTAMQDRASRLQALQRVHGAAPHDEPLQKQSRSQEQNEKSRHVHAQQASTGKGYSGKGLGGVRTQRVHDERSSKALRAGALQNLKDTGHHVSDMHEVDQQASRGRSSTPIDRLRRLQRTRTNSTQPRMESVDSSPSSKPVSQNSGTTLPAAKESAQRFSNAEKKVAPADRVRNENHPGDSTAHSYASRKLKVASSIQHVVANDGPAAANGAKFAIGPVHASSDAPPSVGDTSATSRFGGAKRAAQAHSSEKRVSSRTELLDDIPVGPGKTGARIDFDKLVKQKLQEHGEAPMDVASQLHQCGSCGRQFTAAALERHRTVCVKVFASKRTPMDMTQQRLSSVEGAAGPLGGATSGKAGKSRGSRAAGKPGAVVAPVGDDRPAVAGGVSRAGKWKQKSEQLRAAMNSNKRIQQAQKRGEDVSKLPLYEDSVPDDRVPCPHCNRKFAALTAERHIPRCKDIRAKPSFLKKGSGNAGGNLARLKPSR